MNHVFVDKVKPKSVLVGIYCHIEVHSIVNLCSILGCNQSYEQGEGKEG